MRRRDKIKNMIMANKMAEQYHLNSKGIMTETTVAEGMTHAAGFADGSSGFEEGGNMMQDTGIKSGQAENNNKGTFDIGTDEMVHKFSQQLINYISRTAKATEAEAAFQAGKYLISLGKGQDYARGMTGEAEITEGGGSVTQAIMAAANDGILGGAIYDIVKNFGKNAVLAALQALIGSGDIDGGGIKKIGLIQTIQKLD